MQNNIAVFVEDKQLVNVKPFIDTLTNALTAEKIFEKEITREVKDFLQCLNDCIAISKNKAINLAKTLINSIIVGNKWKVSDNFKNLVNSILEGNKQKKSTIAKLLI